MSERAAGTTADLEAAVRKVVETLDWGLKAARDSYEVYGWTDGHAIQTVGVVSICEGLLGQLGPALCDPLFPAEDKDGRTLPGAPIRRNLGGENISKRLVSWAQIDRSIEDLGKLTKGGKIFGASPYISDQLWKKEQKKADGTSEKYPAKVDEYSNPFAAALVVRAMVDLFRLLEKPIGRLRGSGLKREKEAGELLGAALKFLVDSQFDVAKAVQDEKWRPGAEMKPGEAYRGRAWSWGNPEKIKVPKDNSLSRPSVFFTANAAQALAAYLRYGAKVRRRGDTWANELQEESKVESALREALDWLEIEGAAEAAQQTARGEWGEWGREGKHELILDAYALLALEEGWMALREPDNFRESPAVEAALRRLYGATRLESGVDAAYHTIGGQPGDPWVILFPWEDYSFPYLYLQLLCALLLRHRRDSEPVRPARGIVVDWVELPFFPSLIRGAWEVILREGRGTRKPGEIPKGGWNRLEYRVYCTSWALCAAARLLETLITSVKAKHTGEDVWLGQSVFELDVTETVFLAIEKTLIDRGFFGLFAEQVANSVGRTISGGWLDERLTQFRVTKLRSLTAGSEE